MEQRPEGRNEEAIVSAGIAGAGAVLVGVGLALAFLFGKTRGRLTRIVEAKLNIIGNRVKQEPPRLEIEIDQSNANRIYLIEWQIEGDTAGRRWITFENFRRTLETRGGSSGPGEPVTPLDLDTPGNRSPKDLLTGRRMIRIIDPRAIRDVPPESTHVYSWDVWLDRRKGDDPEIAIIRR